jgi:anti-sigma regulatory factor (Ser/Thr protein kinase)
MNFIPAIAVAFQDQTQIAETRRASQSMAEQLGFDEVRRTEVGIVATELARNTLIHGKHGRVLLSPHHSADEQRVDVIALDKGPGILDLQKCLQDGFSTAGTPGTGLGAVARMANDLQVFSSASKVTAVYARMQVDRSLAEQDTRVAAICVPVKGERVSGDAWAYRRGQGTETYMVVDGLGHGLGAAEAAHEALAVFSAHPELKPAELLRDMHDALKKTRGAAIAIAELDVHQGKLMLAGVGNIAASILSPHKKPRAMVSHNGTVGHVVSRIQEFAFPWESGDLLVMHSDGINTHWDLDALPGLFNKPPALIAGIIFEQGNRGRDDATVLVARLQKVA